MNNNLFIHLKQEHMEVKRLLEQLDKPTTKSAKTREDLLEKLSEKLLPHMQAEEEVFYPALRKNKESTKDMLEALEEHHAARMVIDELKIMPLENENWGAKLHVFKEMIEHHIKEEEHKIFTDAREILSREQFDQILEKFELIEEKQLHEVI
jgi:hemerythrin-like domain-containing protein